MEPLAEVMPGAIRAAATPYDFTFDLATTALLVLVWLVRLASGTLPT